ncbi:hypothetical protein HYALB_00004115 [Hymenoscyphus albidus]|uniref:RING-type domain-containing protein n=1 Tax=Hymenoscyphus albidus TaxID=595503 RepID=A0A9N9LFS7_9HELO|nr:hypothetical protein HYALB_00004115 [Hymenoscyphus albidus]
MDQMDYTMEDTHAGRQPNTTPQCQYQPNLNVSPPRENPHYDPVHDSTSWPPNNSSSHAQSRSSFGQPPTFSQWETGGQYAPLHSWQNHNELHQTPQANSWEMNSERFHNGPMGGMMNSPWNELRPFDSPMTFGYPPYHAASSSNNNNNTASNTAASNQSNGGTSSRTPSALAPTFNPLQPLSVRETAQQILQHELSRSRPARTETSTPSSSHASSQTSRTTHFLATEELMRSSRQPEHRPAYIRANRTRSERWGETPARPLGWDPSDDEDEGELEAEARRQDAEIYLAAGRAEADRAMAALRGAAAVAKRIPSKAAIASLETLKAEDLKPADKTCIICYNEFGIANPEGLTEVPLRLPKCKHIFGDLCIKKWFEDSDSCPYCRDKLPAELSFSKAMASQTARAHRAHFMQHASFRTTRGLPPRYQQYSEEMSARQSAGSLMPRPAEEPDFAMNRAYQAYESATNRASQADFAETRRRQQSRGRNGNSRAPHTLRPMSVGSSRFLTLSMNHPNSQQRNQTQGHSSSATIPATSNPQRASAALVMARQTSASEVLATSTATTPPRNRPSSSFSSPTEEPSPPIAMGSGESTRSHRTRDMSGRDSLGMVDDGWIMGNLATGEPRSSSPGTSSSPPRTFTAANFTFQQPQFGEYNNGLSRSDSSTSTSQARWSQ